VCVCRLQDAVSLVSLFHMVHPHSESAQEAAGQRAAGADLLKVWSDSNLKLEISVCVCVRSLHPRQQLSRSMM